MTVRLTKRQKRMLISLVVALFILIAQKQGWFGQQLETAQPGSYRIAQFVDGDTFVVDMNGSKETVRFTGVDTPETHKPNTPVQCYGLAASAYTKNIIGNQTVRLTLDSDSTDRDRYNRLLRYVYLEDGRLLNKLLIEEGYGFYYPYFPFTKSDEFAAAQAKAQAAHKGIWGTCNPIRKGEGYESNPA